MRKKGAFRKDEVFFSADSAPAAFNFQRKWQDREKKRSRQPVSIQTTRSEKEHLGRRKD